MNLQLSNSGPPFTVKCAGCQRPLLAGNKPNGEAVYFDLSGAPFKDYYCAVCAGERRAHDFSRASRHCTPPSQRGDV